MVLARVALLAYHSRRMVRFSIFGIPVLVHPFFWVTLALIGGALKANSPSAILGLCLFVLAGFISLLIHEIGHALMARKFGAHSEIVLQAFGGFAAYSGVRLSRPQGFAVTAAGPAVQILLGIILFIIIPRLPTISPYGHDFLVILMGISFIWALLNLLPVLPLDGGRLLDSILGPKRFRITLWTTVIVALAIAITSLIIFPKEILLPIFMGMFAWQAWQALRENRRL
jgi:stage IV sporulation protein FB